MDGSNFWLIYIQDNLVVVALVNQSNNQYHVLAIGPAVDWDINSEKSLITAVDESLSAASLNAHITEDQEPSSAAFVVPPFWVDNDGKISAPKLKIIKSLCKELDLIPSGFLSEDEAIVEEANQKDDFPASFILIHLDVNEFYLSLVYLGHVKERIRKNLDQPFTGQILESTLLELNSQSALPPQIILFGAKASEFIDEIKNFPWVGKKDIETFLHFPDVKIYQNDEIINIFSKIITSQVKTILDNPEPSTTEEVVNPISQELFLEEIEADSLGFSSETDAILEDKQIYQDFNDNQKLDNLETPLEVPLATKEIIPEIKKPKFSFSFFKKIKLFKIKKPKFNNLLWIGLIIISLSLAFIFFFSKTEITLFITPFNFNKQIPVTLVVDGSEDDISKSIIPIEKQTFDIKANSQLDTTGQKTVGNKARGEVIIYNKSDQSQSLSNGSILVDDSGKKFELTTAVSIASSSSNLDEGVITLGQTKTAIIATDIGSEFNIDQNSQLKFEKISNTILIARVSQALSGGSKEQINAVSTQDKIDIESKINEEITQKIEEKITNGLGNISGVISGTTQISKDKVDLSREVGEQADQLNATVNASVSIFTVTDSVKEKVLKQFLSDQENFDNTNIDIQNFNFEFKSTKIESQQATGTLSISGLGTPRIDLTKLKKSLIAKTTLKASDIIKKMVNRAYNFNIKNNLPLNLLPFRENNLSIEIESSNL
ncbi:MAG: hypothetical protein PHX34_00695 [Candidatus Shapirobacteria bacterium]|nr:hypothetical protein [Candidatus Shapirobacteria bacterium]